MGQGQGSQLNKIKLRWWWGLEEGPDPGLVPLTLKPHSIGSPHMAGLVRGESKAQIQGLEAESRPGARDGRRPATASGLGPSPIPVLRPQKPLHMPGGDGHRGKA